MICRPLDNKLNYGHSTKIFRGVHASSGAISLAPWAKSHFAPSSIAAIIVLRLCYELVCNLHVMARPKR